MTLDFPAAEAARGSWGGWPEGGLRQIRYRNKICHRQLDQQRHRCVCVARLFLWIHQHLSIWIRTPPKGGLNLDRPHRSPPSPFEFPPTPPLLLTSAVDVLIDSPPSPFPPLSIQGVFDPLLATVATSKRQTAIQFNRSFSLFCGQKPIFPKSAYT